LIGFRVSLIDVLPRTNDVGHCEESRCNRGHEASVEVSFSAQAENPLGGGALDCRVKPFRVNLQDEPDNDRGKRTDCFASLAMT